MMNSSSTPLRTARRATALPPSRDLPKAPVLSWTDLLPGRRSALPSLSDLPSVAFTTSGRAALFEALSQLPLRPGSSVLVPTYHCPTMVAPIIQAGHRPLFYPLGHDGLPVPGAIEALATERPAAMFVAHYFGLPRSLQAVAETCRMHGIALVEDCAHSFFGMAGQRPVGHWGDLATASISKFFPVPEAGLIGSARRTLRPAAQQAPGARAQFKAGWDVLHLALRHGLLAAAQPASLGAVPALEDVGPETIIADCDMARIRQRPTAVALWLHRLLPTGRIATQRQRNYASYHATLGSLAGARGLFGAAPDTAAPYVYPLWIDDPAVADAVYARMRRQAMPVFRWDRLWPGTPRLAGDAGAAWNRQVLQLLCHQNLTAADVQRVAGTIAQALRMESAA